MFRHRRFVRLPLRWHSAPSATELPGSARRAPPWRSRPSARWSFPRWRRFARRWRPDRGGCASRSRRSADTVRHLAASRRPPRNRRPDSGFRTGVAPAPFRPRASGAARRDRESSGRPRSSRMPGRALSSRSGRRDRARCRRRCARSRTRAPPSTPTAWIPCRRTGGIRSVHTRSADVPNSLLPGALSSVDPCSWAKYSKRVSRRQVRGCNRHDGRGLQGSRVASCLSFGFRNSRLAHVSSVRGQPRQSCNASRWLPGQ